MAVNEFNTYVEGITPDAEGNPRWEVGAFQTEVITSEVKPMVSSRDSVKAASVSIADLDWPLIHRSVPNNYPLLLRQCHININQVYTRSKQIRDLRLVRRNHGSRTRLEPNVTLSK